MQGNSEKKISSDADFSHAQFEILIAWSSTIMCTKYCFGPYLFLKIMQIHGEKEMSSYDAYPHALFGLLLARSSTIRRTKSYFCHFFDA